VLRAIVFDFDGVIANSEPLHFRGYRDILSKYGVALAEGDYYSRYLGYDDHAAFAAIGADAGVKWSPSQIADLIRQKAERLEELERGESVLFPGAETAIQTAAGSVPIAIASGALGNEIRRVLDRARLTHHFTAIVAAEDTAAGKPSPDPYLRAMSMLVAACGPMDPRHCVAVEDSRWGLQSAREAGLRTLAVAQTYGAESLQPADLIIPSMEACDLRAIEQLFV
jgi:HAD superfamily hydrolase (TIGR01509 family)